MSTIIKLSEQKRITGEIIFYLNSLPEYGGTKNHYNLWDLHILKSLVNDIEFYLHIDEIEKGNILFGCYGKFNKHVQGLTKPYNFKYNFYFDNDLDIEDFRQYLDYVLDALRNKNI